MPTTLTSVLPQMMKMRDHPVEEAEEVVEAEEVAEEVLLMATEVEPEDKTQSRVLRRPRMISQLYELDDQPSINQRSWLVSE